MGYLINRGTKKDPVYYGAFKDIDDVWKRKRTGQRTEQAAYKVLEAWEARVAQGLPGIPGESEKRAAAEARQRAEVARKLTVADLARRFLQEYQRPKIRDILSYRQTYGSYIKGGILAAPLAATPAASVRKVDVERWRDTFLSGRYAPSTINNILGILGTIYNWAGEQDLVMVRNPCRGVEDMPALPSQEHYSLEEVHRLLALPECPAAVWCALYTGMRPGELRGLTWPCVHMDAQIPYIDVRRSYRGPTKSGKPRAVPIHPELLPILRQWQNECPVTDEALVFPVEVKGRYRMACDTDRDNLAELLEAAGCHVPQEPARRGRKPNRRVWHAMRHTFSTLLMEASGNGDALSKLLGHSQGAGEAAVTRGYTHTSLAYLQRELVKMTLLPPAPAGVTSIHAVRERAAAG